MQNRRKIKFVDQEIQGYLMVSLIVLESIMVTIAMTYLYFRFNDTFDDSIYQIHPSSSDSIYKLLGTEMAWVVVIMSIINFTALFIAHLLWLRHINKIITFFRASMFRVKKLSLNFPKSEQVPKHDLTSQLIKWQQHEQIRAQQINHIIDALPTQPDEINSESLSRSIKQLQTLLSFVDQKQVR